ncbi:hypothetical protein J3R83DRAFT_11769 [Lanmaoa asiatica]|nr:hypothetical protein J3R83DRAFT_11769 [Lanmaoa asiatica]
MEVGSWTETGSEPGRCIWKRSLGITEAVFYWDGIFNGTADTVMHVQLKVNRPEDAGMYACKNVQRAWASVKRRFPLLAAEVEEVEEDTRLNFIVREENVMGPRNEELTLITIPSLLAAEHFLTNLLDAPRPLSSRILARIYILRRTDTPLHIHVIFTVAHCITDGCSTSTILRTFFQTMACAYDPAPLSLVARLDMCRPLESRIQDRGVPLSRRRWYRAIGYALHAVRLGRFRVRRFHVFEKDEWGLRGIGRPYDSRTIHNDDTTHSSAVALSACPVPARYVACDLGQLSAIRNHVDVCILCTESSGVVTGIVSEVFEGRDIRGRVDVSEARANVFQWAD